MLLLLLLRFFALVLNAPVSTLVLLLACYHSANRKQRAGVVGGAMAIASDAGATKSSIIGSRFVGCVASNKGGALLLTGGATSVTDCEFANCAVAPDVSEEKCLELTMKTTIPQSMWSGAVRF